MSKGLKVLLTVIVTLLLLLIVTNPSYKDFEEFSADYNSTSLEYYKAYHNVVRRKLLSRFIYSIYQSQIYQITTDQSNAKSVFVIKEQHHYLGILGNFFELKN